MNSEGRDIVGSGEWGLESGRQAGKFSFDRSELTDQTDHFMEDLWDSCKVALRGFGEECRRFIFLIYEGWTCTD